jgi:hypothetical protein
MAITLEGRPMGTYPFEFFQTSLGSTLCTNSEIKSDLSVESVPSSAHQCDSVSATSRQYDEWINHSFTQ